MKNLRTLLAVFTLLSCAASAFAQVDEGGGAVGSICEVGQPCPVPGSGEGGGAPIDPSPYDPQPGRPPRPQPPRPPPRPGYGDRREVYIGQEFQDQNLDLVRTLNLWNLRGASIESVDVVTRSYGGYGVLQLLADGYIEDSQNVYSDYVSLRVRRDLSIGYNVRDLLLSIRGRLYIERVIVNFRGGGGGYYPGPQPGPQPGPIGGDVVIPLNVGQIFYSPASVDLLARTMLSNYRGYRVAAVTIYGQSLAYRGGTQLVGNGMLLGQVDFSPNGGGFTIYPNSQLIVGVNLSSLNLMTNGQIRIDRVDLRLQR